MTQAEDLQEADSSLIVNSMFNAFSSYTAIMLNIITIHALRKTLSLPKPLKTLLLSLAVSDLGVGLLVQPLHVAYFVMRLKENTENSLTIKNTFIFTSFFFCFASFLGVTALTADRFLAIHLHLRYQELVTRRRVVAVVTSVWLFSASYSAPVLLWNRKIYAVFTGIIVTVCLVLTAFFYCKIYLAVRRHKNQLQVLQVQQVTQNDEVMVNAARQMKSAVGTFYVYLVFLVCYLPFISINVVEAITGPRALITLFDYTRTLVLLNSSLNPLVYCWKMKHIRHVMMNILRNMFSSKTTN